MRYTDKSNQNDDSNLDHPVDENLAAVNDRLDELARRIERMTQGKAGGREDKRRDYRDPDHVSEALARLDNRLEQIVIDHRRADSADTGRRNPLSAAARPPSAPPSAAKPRSPSGAPNWVAEILARRRLLDGESPSVAPRTATPAPAPAAPAAAAPPLAPTVDLSGLEQQLHVLTREIASLHAPYEDALQSLRRDLAEVSQTVTEAMPRRAVEALQVEVRRLGERIDHGRDAGIDAKALAGLEQGLAEVRDALSETMPRRAMEALQGEIRTLGELINTSRDGGVDANLLAGLDHGFSEIRAALTDAMPRRAIEALQAEVRNLGERIDHGRDTGIDANLLAGLDHGFAEIRAALTEATPRRAIEALQTEVRSLGDRMDQNREAGIDVDALARLENGLADVRDGLHHLAPAESLVGLEEALHVLAQKIDQTGGSLQQEPADLRQIEHAISQLRGLISNVATDGALAQVAAEVHSLTARFEQLSNESATEAIYQLESRVAAVLDQDRSMPEMLDAVVRTLNDRLDSMQLSQGDQVALVALEDRIVQLAEKLDASDARLRNLDNIERGIGDLLIVLDEIRNERGQAAPKAAEPAPFSPQPEPPYNPMFSATQPNPPAAAAPIPTPRPTAERTRDLDPPRDIDPPPPPALRTAQRSEARRPINPDLPPDTPLEPGRQHKPGSPAARIAASEAALGDAVPTVTSVGGKAAAIAAARHALAAYVPVPADDASKSKGGWFRVWKRSKPKAAAEPEPAIKPAPAPAATAEDEPINLDRPDAPVARKRIVSHIRTVLVAASVVIIVLGTLQAAMDFFMPETVSDTPATTDNMVAPEPGEPTTTIVVPGPEPQAAPSPAPAPTPAPAPAPKRDTTGQLGIPPAPPPEPTATLTPEPPSADITGSIPWHPAVPTRSMIPTAQPPVSALPPALEPAVAALPSSIGPALRAAAADGNPAAAYEISLRYAEGRGLLRSAADSMYWLERAAKAGFAPAQYRLGSFNEKGDGVKKDVDNARRLYLAAAAQGHAKAMHNLAVLYAEGIDGKPDFQIAAEWFRKAAIHGVADSQYNLAILYARGIGVEQNLAEAYRWFALAAAKGDQDSGKKRDDIANRLDRQTLVAAKLAVQTFIPEPEPEVAVSLQVPNGGWDRATAAVQTPKPKAQTPAPASR